MADIVTGARARFSINGVKAGFATGVTLREVITYEPVKVLDDIIVKEHVPTDYDVSMTADYVRIVLDTVKSRGEFPQQGQTSEEFLTNIINNGELSATLEDSQTNQIIAKVEGVKISERSVTIAARGVVGENVSMVAKKARDESDLT
jgi:hypothetical protein